MDIDFSASIFSFLTSSERKQLKNIFEQALKNTDKQLSIKRDGTAYVKTGDIPAEWLRDSSAQARPYLFFAKEDKNIAEKLKAVIQRQALYILIDPYANAFRKDFKIRQRKFELDSLSYPILLAWTFWKVTGDISIFTPEVKKGFIRALETMEIEQDHTKSKYRYLFSKKNPFKYTGMIWSGFRPSDDWCVYNFLIPSQIQAVQALTALEEIEIFFKEKDIASRARKLRDEVNKGIEKFGTVLHPKYGRIYAYEVDGLGNSLLMDDGNLPNLLSIPYFGYTNVSDEVYVATRRFVLSSDNPYFYSGSFNNQNISGVGSHHTPNNKLLWFVEFIKEIGKKDKKEQIETLKTLLSARHKSKGMIWPLGLLAQGLTTENSEEQIKVLKMLLASDSGDHRMHESFLPNNPLVYTRKDFGWPNALFAEFMLTKFFDYPPLPIPNPPQKSSLKNKK